MPLRSFRPLLEVLEDRYVPTGSFSLTGVEPGAAQRITRGVKRRLELQCALKLGDGGRQVTHRKKPFTESECRFGDARTQRRGVPQNLQGLFVVPSCQQGAPEGNSGEQPAATGLQLRFQELSGAGCVACCDPQLRLAQRIIICAGIHLGINARVGPIRLHNPNWEGTPMAGTGRSGR